VTDVVAPRTHLEELDLEEQDPEQEPALIEVRLAVQPQYQGWRLDRFIKACIPRLSRSRIQQMIHAQRELQGLCLRPADRVRGGDEICLLRPRPHEPDVPREFRVLFSDGQLMAIDKPAGLPVHATARFHKNTLTCLLRERFGEPCPTLAHRLDRETSGLMLLGQTREAGVALKALFRERRVHKRYLALVHGCPDPTSGTIELPLGPDTASGIRVKMGVVQGGFPARTRYHVLERRGDFSLLEAFPETGRQHQIRAHLGALGVPLVGDKLYGPDPSLFLEFIETGWSASLSERLLLPRHALHAADASFPHPVSQAPTHLSCDLPLDLRRFWENVGNSGSFS
jgi:23S rRNA pseudouridine1911/1915/1917 synthase